MKKILKIQIIFKNLIASASKQFKNKFVALIPSAIPACTYKIFSTTEKKNRNSVEMRKKKNPSEFFSPFTPQFEGIAVHSRCKLYWLDGENEKFISHAEGNLFKNVDSMENLIQKISTTFN